MYLVAVIDWHNLYVLAWQLSNTLDGIFCLDTLREALSKGRSKIFDTDQSTQFTADAFTACSQPTFGSAWMAAAAPSTTSFANAYAAASNLRTSLSTSMTPCLSCTLA